MKVGVWRLYGASGAKQDFLATLQYCLMLFKFFEYTEDSLPYFLYIGVLILIAKSNKAHPKNDGQI